MTEIVVDSRFAGPPMMGHGGYVAGVLAERVEGAARITLRRPTPLDTPLDVVVGDDGAVELRHGEHVVATAEPTTLSIAVPSPPAVADAAAARAESPSFHDAHGPGRKGVHPTCFGCGNLREPGDALRIFAGPVSVDGHELVADAWRPGEAFASADGTVAKRWVVAALDCPGAFAFIAGGSRAGLLGRLEVEQYADVVADDEHLVTGWQIGSEGRKLFAGTALHRAADGALLAAASATWFQTAPAG